MYVFMCASVTMCMVHVCVCTVYKCTTCIACVESADFSNTKLNLFV